MSAFARSVSAPNDEEGLRRGAMSLRHPLTRALLALTFTTGLVDAVSYLALGRVFTANMTGNIVLLGFGIAGSDGLPVVGPGSIRRSAAVLTMLAGALCGALLLKTQVFVPLALAAVMALATWLVYVPAAVRLGSGRPGQGTVIAATPPLQPAHRTTLR